MRAEERVYESPKFSWKKQEKTGIYPSCFQLFFEDDLWREVGTSILKESCFHEIEKMKLSRREIEEKLLSFETNGAFSFLIHKLSQRAMTEHEARKLLFRHKVSPEVVEKTLARVIRDGYISDQAMLESLSKKLLGQKKSVQVIKMKLKTRFGRNVDLISEDDVKENECDQKSLEALIQKKFMKDIAAIKGNREAFHRLVAKLCRRGFSYELVLDTVKEQLKSSTGTF